MAGQPLIIVTGAAGFIGSALAWRLNRLGRQDLILVDDLGSDIRWKNLAPLAYREFLGKDEFLESLRNGAWDGEPIEAVFHLGACSSTTVTDMGYLARNNYAYSRSLAEWCLDRPSPIRFVYASSAATYGDGTSGYADDHARLPSLRPLNAYGYSKHMFDLWNLRNGHLDRVAGLKYFNVFGPNEFHKGDMMSMAAKAFRQIRDEGLVRLFRSYRPDYPDGGQVRDFLYVKDAVDMTLHFLDPKVPGGIYNIGTGETRTWLDLAQALFRVLGREPRIEFIPMPEAIRGQYQYHTRADMAKLRSAGYAKPVLSLEDAVADYVPYLESGLTLGWS
jgi:ADP-L-glycero-D-manno-heptose 6-epimerase